MDAGLKKRSVLRLDLKESLEGVHLSEREVEIVPRGCAQNGERTRTQSGQLGPGDLVDESV